MARPLILPESQGESEDTFVCADCEEPITDGEAAIECVEGRVEGDDFAERGGMLCYYHQECFDNVVEQGSKK